MARFSMNRTVGFSSVVTLGFVASTLGFVLLLWS